MNCIGQVSVLSNIETSLSPTVVMETKHKRYGEKFLKHRLHLDTEQFTVLFSDEKYKSLATTNTSSTHVVDQNGKRLFDGELKSLMQDLPTINGFATATKEQVLLTLPDSVILSSQYHFQKANTGYYIHDYLFNQIYYAGNNGTIQTINASSLDKEKLHQKAFNDLKNYRASLFYKDVLIKLNQNEVTIESIQVQDNQLYAMVKLPYPVIQTKDGKKGLIVKSTFLMVEWKDQQITDIYPIEQPTTDSEYGVDAISFTLEDDIIYCPVIKLNLEGKSYFMAKYQKTPEGLKFQNFIDADVPSFFKERNLVYQYFNFQKVNNFAFFEYGNNYVDLAKGTTYTLPTSIVDFNNQNDFKNFSVLATTIEDEIIYLLYQKDKAYYLAQIEKSNATILKKQKLDFPENITASPSNWIFTPSGELLVINNDNQIVSAQKVSLTTEDAGNGRKIGAK